MSMPTTTYIEAAQHCQRLHESTNGLVVGGTYRVRFDDGTVREIELSITSTGVARPTHR